VTAQSGWGARFNGLWEIISEVSFSASLTGKNNFFKRLIKNQIFFAQLGIASSADQSASSQ